MNTSTIKAVAIKDLLSALANKALDITFENGKITADLGGVEITEEQAHFLCKEQLGWGTYVLSPFEIIDKTEKFTKALKRELKDDYIIENTVVTFMNKKDTEYGRTFDRITFDCKHKFKYTVIYNMKSAGGAYVLYNTGNAIPVKKFKNMKQLLVYLQADSDN